MAASAAPNAQVQSDKFNNDQAMPVVTSDGAVRHPPPPPPPPRKAAEEPDPELEALSRMLDNFSWSGDAVESCARAIMDPNGSFPSKLKGLLQLKQLLSTSREHVFRIAQDVIESGVLKGLVALTGAEVPSDLRLPAAFCLTNIAAGHDDQTAAVVAAGAIPKCLEMLRCPAENLRRQAIFCLANVAGSTPEFRKVLASHSQYFSSIIFAVLHAKDPKVEELAGWNIRNMCVLGGPDLDEVKPGIDFFADQLHRNTPNATDCRTLLVTGSATLGAVMAGPDMPVWSRHQYCGPALGLAYHSPTGLSAAVLRFACETFGFISRTPQGRNEILAQELGVPLLFHAKFNLHHSVRNYALDCLANLMQHGPPEARLTLEKLGAVYALSELLADYLSYTPHQRTLTARALYGLAAEGYPSHASSMVEPFILTRDHARVVIAEARTRLHTNQQQASLESADFDFDDLEVTQRDRVLYQALKLRFDNDSSGPFSGASTLEIAYNIFAQTNRPEEFALRERCGRLMIAILLRSSNALLWSSLNGELLRLVLDILDMAVLQDAQQCLSEDAIEEVMSGSFVGSVLRLLERFFEMGEDLQRRDQALDNPIITLLAQNDGLSRLQNAVTRSILPYQVIEKTLTLINRYEGS